MTTVTLEGVARTVNVDQRRRELARALYRVVDRVGIEGASLRVVAAEAGCTTGSLTHHFADRRELLEYALGLVISETMERVLDTAARGSLLDALCELLPLDEARRHEGAAWLVSISAARRDPALAAALGHRYGTSRSLLVGLLTDRLRTSGRGVVDGPELELLADEVITGVDGVATYGLADPDRYPPERQRELVARILTRVGLEEHHPPAAGGG